MSITHEFRDTTCKRIAASTPCERIVEGYECSALVTHIVTNRRGDYSLAVCSECVQHFLNSPFVNIVALLKHDA